MAEIKVNDIILEENEPNPVLVSFTSDEDAQTATNWKKTIISSPISDATFIGTRYINANAHKITNLKAPDTDTDAVNKGYVDNLSTVYETKNDHNSDISKVNTSISAKQNKLTAGTGISISGSTISVSLTADMLFQLLEAGEGIKIELNNGKVKIGEI